MEEKHLTDAYSYMEAEIIMSLLKSEGIPSYKKVKGFGEYLNIVLGGNTPAFIKIYVRADDYERAKAILDAVPVEEEEDDFELYESVKIKSRNITGVIVSISTGDGKEPPIYFVEVDDEYKTGEFTDDLVWYEAEEIEKI